MEKFQSQLSQKKSLEQLNSVVMEIADATEFKMHQDNDSCLKC